MNRIRDVFGHPIIMMVLLVSVLFLILQSFHLPYSGTLFDQFMFYFIASISGLTALFILVRTKWRDWTYLGAGLLGHFLAVGLVFFVSVWYTNHQIMPYTNELIILTRAMLVISGMFVLFGIIAEWLADLNCDLACVWDRITHPVHSFKRWFSKHQR